LHLVGYLYYLIETLVSIPCVEFYILLTDNLESAEKLSFSRWRKTRLSLHLFARNARFLNGIKCGTSWRTALNSIKKQWKYLSIHLHTSL